MPQHVCSSKASFCWFVWVVLVRACRFVWDEGKYPTMSPLKEIVGSIQTQVAKIEDDMKVGFVSQNTTLMPGQNVLYKDPLTST